MVAQLLREFVEDPWVGELDLDEMQRVNARFHGRAGRRRDSDVIWRIPMRAGGDAYLLLLLEFQSKIDRFMAVRVMVYAGLLWQQLVQEKRLTPDGRLPPVFPVVIYNGDPRWHAPDALAPLIALPEGSPLWQWQPGMRHRVIDEGAFAAADLAGRDTLAALLFRLENAPEPEQIEAIVDAVIDWFRAHDGFEALMPLFAGLAHRVIDGHGGASPGARVAENLQEVRTMLANRPAEWKLRWTQEGLVRGREEGRQEGEASAVTRLLEHRFGPLPDAAKARIASADLPTLQAWSLRILDAGSIGDVLN